MKTGFLRLICATSVMALIVAFAAPQTGPTGPRRPPGNSGGDQGGGGTRGGGNGGGSGGGSGPTRRVEPPPVRTEQGRGGGSQGGGTRPGGPGPGSGGNDRGGTVLPGSGGTRGGGGGSVFDRDNGGTRTGGGSRDGDRIILPGDRVGGVQGTRGTSRSGEVRYGTVNNIGTRAGVPSSIRLERPPVIINNGTLQRRVGNSENIGLVNNGFRSGYFHWNQTWRDDFFCYPFYVFDPFTVNQFAVSPWYYYWSLPGYINPTRVVFVNTFPTTNWFGSPYRWEPVRDRFDSRWRDQSELDYALQDLVDAFERNDRRAMDRLVPRRGGVNIYNDGRYAYTLDSNDFYDLFQDGILSNRTRRYEVLDVETNNRGGARVYARHETVDPWDARNVVYHQIFLERSGRDWVIREFGTSINRNRW